ncbi:MAG: helix-turn-helix domain-containing protein [bacterium]
MNKKLKTLFKLNLPTKGFKGLKKYKILTCLVFEADNNNIVNLTQEQIARTVGCSYVYVNLIIKDLCDRKLISKDSNGRNNIYNLTSLFKTIKSEDDNA